MTTFDPRYPDLGQHMWHEEGGFYHGYIDGVYYRMVCTREELEWVRQIESGGKETPLDTDEVWWALYEQDYVDPWNAWYEEFESASPLEIDLDFESRRRSIALNMYLDADTTTWYELRTQYDELMSIWQRDRDRVLKYRMFALGLDPKKEQLPNIRSLRTHALALGLNPYRATWQEICSADIELHKVLLPQALAWRARGHLLGKKMNFKDLFQRALEYYLDSHEERIMGGEEFKG